MVSLTLRVTRRRLAYSNCLAKICAFCADDVASVGHDTIRLHTTRAEVSDVTRKSRDLSNIALYDDFLFVHLTRLLYIQHA